MSSAISLVEVDIAQFLIEGSLYTSEGLLLFHIVNSAVTLISIMYLLFAAYLILFCLCTNVLCFCSAIILILACLLIFPTVRLYCHTELSRRGLCGFNAVCVFVWMWEWWVYLVVLFILHTVRGVIALQWSWSVRWNGHTFLYFFWVFFLLSKCLIFSFHRLTSSIFLYSPAPSSCLLLNILSSFLAPDGLSPPTLAHATNASLNVSWSAPVNSNAPGPLYYSLQMRTSPQRPIIRWETP